MPTSVPIRPRLSCLRGPLAPRGKPGSILPANPTGSEVPGCYQAGVPRAGASTALRRLRRDFLCGHRRPVVCRGRRPTKSPLSEPPLVGPRALKHRTCYAPWRGHTGEAGSHRVPCPGGQTTLHPASSCVSIAKEVPNPRAPATVSGQEATLRAKSRDSPKPSSTDI